MFSQRKVERDIAKLKKQQEKIDKEKEKLIEKKNIEDKKEEEKVEKDVNLEQAPINYEAYSNKELLEIISDCWGEIASRTEEA